MGEWREVRIGDFLHRVKQPVQLQDDENYKLVTVRMHHNGVVLRELKKGVHPQNLWVASGSGRFPSV